MIGTCTCAILEGIEATVIQVEADVSSGLPVFSIVGLPDSAVSESKLRIRSAIKNSGLRFPSQRITVNLSPASMKKRGAGLDLAIAVAILRADGQLLQDNESSLAMCAELSLSGALVPIQGLLNIGLALHKASIPAVVIATHQQMDCADIPNFAWHPVETLEELVQYLRKRAVSLPSLSRPINHASPTVSVKSGERCSPPAEDELGDFSDVQGLTLAKRALEIAAAGRHHVLLVGPPGCGKTMLAERFVTILPRLSPAERLDVSAIHQASGLPRPISPVPPTRAPHHSITVATFPKWVAVLLFAVLVIYCMWVASFGF